MIFLRTANEIIQTDILYQLQQINVHTFNDVIQENGYLMSNAYTTTRNSYT